MSDIIINNQPVLSKILNKIQKSNTNVQAYMLYGDSKEILRNYAIMFAKVLICPREYCDNCNKCNICRRIDNNVYGELKIVNPVNKMIKKEAVLEAKETFNTESIEGKNGVYIINDVELLNTSAANAILKFLEEPDGNSVAIFTTTNLDAVIKTISSRCQTIKINNYKVKRGIEFVMEVSGFDEETIYKIVDFTKKIEKDKAGAISNIKNEFINNFDNKDALMNALNVMLLYYKDMLNYLIRNKCFYFDVNDVKLALNNQDKDLISRKISFILENISKLEYNVNVLLFMDNLIIRIGEMNDD